MKGAQKSVTSYFHSKYFVSIVVAVPAINMTTQDKTVFGSIFYQFWSQTLSFSQLKLLLPPVLWVRWASYEWWASKDQIKYFFREFISTWCKRILTWSEIREEAFPGKLQYVSRKHWSHRKSRSLTSNFSVQHGVVRPIANSAEQCMLIRMNFPR